MDWGDNEDNTCLDGSSDGEQQHFPELLFWLLLFFLLEQQETIDELFNGDDDKGFEILVLKARQGAVEVEGWSITGENIFAFDVDDDNEEGVDVWWWSFWFSVKSADGEDDI